MAQSAGLLPVKRWTVDKPENIQTSRRRQSRVQQCALAMSLIVLALNVQAWLTWMAGEIKTPEQPIF